MKLHQENIFRYLLACFLVAAFGLYATWSTSEKQQQLRVADQTGAALSIDTAGDRAPASEQQ